MKGNRIRTDDMPAHEVFIHEYLCEVRYNFVSVTDEEGNVSLNYEYEKGETLKELEQKLRDKGVSNASDLVYTYPEVSQDGYVLKNKLFQDGDNVVRAKQNANAVNADYELI
ncbi:MAG: hypothetical protein ACOCTU_07005 [Bacteroidota bacterium]